MRIAILFLSLMFVSGCGIPVPVGNASRIEVVLDHGCRTLTISAPPDWSGTVYIRKGIRVKEIEADQ